MAGSVDAGSGAAGRPVLSPLIHGRVRLLVLSFLLPRKKGAPFTELRQALELTDGTLSVHLAKLEDGGLVRQEKGFVGKRPRTMVRVTAEGRRSFKKYVQELRRVVPGLEEG